MIPLRKIDTRAGAEAAAGADAPGRVAPDAPSALLQARVQPQPSLAPEYGAELLLHTVLLSGVGGYVDAAGFVSLLGVFPAHLTGELVGDAIAVSAGHFGAHAARLWMFPVFMLSIALSSLVARFLHGRQRHELTVLLALLTASLALFSACDAVAHVLHHQHLPLWLSGSCAVAAMGFQTALIRESLNSSCPTTVMTGNIAQVMVDFLDQLVGPRARARGVRERSRLVAVSSALLAFAICATLGGWLARRLGTTSIILPTVVTAALTVRAWAAARKPPVRAEDPPTPAPWFDDDDFWPDSSETEALAPLYCAEFESLTRIKAEPVVPDGSIPEAPRHASGTRLAVRSGTDK
ncbi:MAG: YoaK family protein [Polyangiaceae bacterium]